VLESTATGAGVVCTDTKPMCSVQWERLQGYLCCCCCCVMLTSAVLCCARVCVSQVGLWKRSMSVMLEIMDLLNTHSHIILDDTGEGARGFFWGGGWGLQHSRAL
jgi:hypothetical protein